MKPGDLLAISTKYPIIVWGDKYRKLGKISENELVIYITSRTSYNHNYIVVISKYGISEIEKIYVKQVL
jgi:hypothetical protein